MRLIVSVGVILSGCLASVFAGGEGRVVTPFNEGWTFDGKPVTLPHTWNATDIADGIPGLTDGDEVMRRFRCNAIACPGYDHREGYYEHTLPKRREGRRYFVRFKAASAVATVRVNAKLVGSHKGAFTAFAFDVTDFLLPDRESLLGVTVSNAVDPDVPPISADFSLPGGLYRGAELIETDENGISPTHFGGPGVEIRTEPSGNVTVRTEIFGADAGRGKRTYTVTDPAGGEPMVFTRDRFTLPADRVRLWTPETPHVYTLTAALEGESWRDEVTVTFGFRDFQFREDGLYVNGVRRRLRGVNRHQDREGVSWAQTAAMEAEDVALIKEIGADTLRTAHYPQSEHFYDLTDRAGLACWVELSLVNEVLPSEAFLVNAKNFAREMVAQFGNHPSIFCWSVFNELYMGVNQKTADCALYARTVSELNDLFHALDTTRPTVAATAFGGSREVNDVTDQLAINIYPRWYWNSDKPDFLDDAFGSNFDAQAHRRSILGISEYGAGGGVHTHADPCPSSVEATGRFHPEEYQTDVHRTVWQKIAASDWIWGSYVWAMFDFASDCRTEGEKDGINDKGLVTRDRQTRKDAFYFYKANWNPEPMLHLCSKRMTSTTNAVSEVVAFANTGRPVELWLNGGKIAEATPDSVKTVRFTAPLRPGDNKIEVRSAGLVESAARRLSK